MKASSVSLLRVVTLATCLVPTLAVAQTTTPVKPSPVPTPDRVRPKERLTPQTLPIFLEAVRKNYDLPSLGVAVLRDDRVSIATVGVRKMGDPTPVTDEDGWHLGSRTKSMTSTLMAMLVEEGKLSWDSTLAEMLPGMTDVMRPAYKGVTLSQLLSHRAGLPTSTVPAGTTYDDWRLKKEPLTEQRLAYVKGCLAQGPVYSPGTKMLYSNFGYVIAGAIAERITGQSWEELMKKRLFEPLGMNSVTYGTQSIEPPLEPWPHFVKDGKPVVTPKGLSIELPLVVGPAGMVRCSLADWAKYAKFWLHGLRGESDLLQPESFQLMISPPDAHKPSGTDEGDGYAYGWFIAKRSWSRGTVPYHPGSNLANYSIIWLAPQENFAVLIVTNRGEASTPLDDVAAAVLTELSRVSNS